ncbi:hypothetical protein DICPUDRAFT_93560 [Dictyostelium purpureum]|uniref:non-specific serine/threonine protein kinase n=1 Tax=Dictyostelium purpureum TaxID=5786 RepID=F0Z913_DICPU|nr:uncharacterized protein DICPUDRAFT_93560 [Dictyostelium purpureum]EGC39554.1 hypothetical protein DICPUDRAFT_93560 [Dictyostelium purpureum]|eukprot:XP_003283889.1 hypothetical protein DICPUDRAFT_93560 [Dictyostelium purpureum]
MEESTPVNDFKLPEGIKDPSLEFDLLECLGRGSFGSVFKAIYKRTGTVVAVKLVPINEDFQEILKEINIMKQCKSKYVVQYYGNYFKDETCWIIMEYCSNGSVSDMMNITNRVLNEEQIALVCYSTLKGLYYLHRNSKIHRDIKPGNILVNDLGECKLADFGVSGQLSERTRKRNTVIGTPFFLAPEVIQEVGYDNKADIWALGITAIEMAEFHPPYHDLHPMRVLFMIPTSPSPTLKEPQKYSPEFSDFIALCLAKEQSQRPSAKDLLKHPFFEKQLKGSYVMKSLSETAEMVIERAGGREEAIKAASERKSKQSGQPFEFIHCEKVDEPDSSDEEDLLEKNNRRLSQIQENKRQQQSPPPPAQPQQSLNMSGQFGKNKNDDINELDSLLSNMMSSSAASTSSYNSSHSASANNNSNASSSPSPTSISNSRGNVGNVGYTNNSSVESSSSFKQPQPSTPQQQYQQHQTNGFSPSPRSSVEISKPKAAASELDDLLEEMLNPSFGNRPRGLTPISSPVTKRPPSTGIPSSPVTHSSQPTISNRVNGIWSGETAGGCANTPLWRKNPQYLLQIVQTTTIRITLRQTGDKLVHIGFYFAKANQGQDQNKRRISLTKENLVPGIDITFLKNTEVSAKITMEPGYYVIIPATFEPGQEGTFELEVTPIASTGFIDGNSISNHVRLSEVQQDRDWKTISGRFEWRGPTAGGSFSGSSATWKDNPKFFFEINQTCNNTIILGKHNDMPKETYIGFYIFKADKTCPFISLTANNLFSKTSFVNGLEVVHNQNQMPPGSYIIVPCTYDARQEGSFSLTCYSDGQINRLDLSEQILTVHGEWKGPSAGGCLNHTTWRNNSQYLVHNTSNLPTKITIMLEQLEKMDNQQLPFVGFYVAKSPTPILNKKLFSLTPKDIVGNTEFINDYQVHFTSIMEPNSSYVIIPSTFTPNIEYPFNLRVITNNHNAISITRLPDWSTRTLSGEWRQGTCGGRYSNTSSSWTLNPRFRFNLPKGGRFTVILAQAEKSNYNGIGFYYFKTLPDGSLKEFVCKSGFICGKEIVLESTTNDSISGVLIPSTFEPGILDSFSIIIYSEYDSDFYQ